MVEEIESVLDSSFVEEGRFMGLQAEKHHDPSESTTDPHIWINLLAKTLILHFVSATLPMMNVVIKISADL